MKTLIRLILAIIVLAYPFVIYFGLLYFKFWQVALVVMVVAILRLSVINVQPSKHFKMGFIGAVLLLLFAVLAMIFEQQVWFKIYPIAISVTLFYVFASSLWTDKSMIQRFAEIRETNIGPEKQLYMQKLTSVWCGFFVLNAMFSTYTLLFSSDKQWMLYNGLISYLLMGALGLGELLYRHLVVMRRLP